MSLIEKTVFLSYRRTNSPWALAIFQNLTNHGYDVFIDYMGIAAGDFESVILENVAARAHFLVLLTPSALERCSEPDDWLRREIETAMDKRRNIVPLKLENFEFGVPSTRSQLTGKLAALSSYQALTVPLDFFMEAMNRLRERYLSVDPKAVRHPASLSALQAAKEQQAAAMNAPEVQKEELTAQGCFERGYAASDPEEAIRYYTETIRLNPNFAMAFYNRAIARQDKGDLQGALQDYNQAIRLNPRDADAFLNRGVALADDGDQDSALRDYDKAIELDPEYADAFMNRGAVRQETGDLAGALQDYDEALRLAPDSAETFYNRGIARQEQGDSEGALQDYDSALRLKPDYAEALYNRGALFQDRGDLAKALQDYSEAIRLAPNDPVTYFNRAQIFADKAEYAKAIVDYRNYLQLGGGLDSGDQEQVEEEIRDLRTRIGEPEASGVA